MCTVTYIPTDNGVILTSNRDEKIMRSLALPPAIYNSSENILVYPKDSTANGTWICANGNGNAVVLLNGAFVRHIPNPPYRKSRGIVLLDVIDTKSPIAHFEKMDLDSIEPFTMVIYENLDLFEIRWDGNKKYVAKKDVSKRHIWNSATLYDENVIALRKSWFNEWNDKNPNPTIDSIFSFHKFTGDGNSEHDLMMSKEGIWITVSITSLHLEDRKASMIYEDLLIGEKHPIELNFKNKLEV